MIVNVALKFSDLIAEKSPFSEAKAARKLKVFAKFWQIAIVRTVVAEYRKRPVSPTV